MALLLKDCQEAFWRKESTVGFPEGGYWCIMRKRGSRTTISNNQHTSKKSKRERWVNAYAQKNDVRARKLSKYGGTSRVSFMGLGR